MAIMLKANGKFLVEVETPYGRVRRTTLTRQEAESLEVTLKVMTKPTPPVSEYTVGHLANDAKTLWRGTKDETQSLKRFEVAMALLGHTTPLHRVRTAAMDKMVEELRSRGLSDSTIHRYLSTVSAALRWAVSRDLIMGMPIIPWTKSSEQRDIVISEADDQRLVNWLRDMGHKEIALVYDVLLSTGCRIGELLDLEAGDINVIEEEVTFRDTKNGTDRTVPLNHELCVALEAIIEDGKMPSYRRIYLAAEKAREALKLAHKVTPHVMRHTVATRLAADNEVSIKTIGTLLGHKSERTTNRYLHPEKQTIKRAAAKLTRS